MPPETPFPQNLKIYNILLALAALIICASGFAATTNERAINEHQFYLLQNYKLIYAEEIFDYCVNRFGALSPGLGSCLRKNESLKQNILSDALEQLGRQSLAQSIYDECLDYYPMEAVKPVGECVYTRLYLRRELNDDSEERRVYRKCNLKWRNHGYNAVDNCATSEVTFYRRWGKYNDE